MQAMVPTVAPGLVKCIDSGESRVAQMVSIAISRTRQLGQPEIKHLLLALVD